MSIDQQVMCIIDAETGRVHAVVQNTDDAYNQMLEDNSDVCLSWLVTDQDSARFLLKQAKNKLGKDFKNLQVAQELKALLLYDDV